jgi:1-acyl-sn-glycerol-3-phosphate acyltransferase
MIMCDLPASLLAGQRFYGMAADSVFRIPLWRHVYTWLGIVPASAANLRRYLKWGSVGITPGGIAEMYLAGGGAGHMSTSYTMASTS